MEIVHLRRDFMVMMVLGNGCIATMHVRILAQVSVS